MSVQDYRVNAEVRRLLVSRWIDVSLVQIGTTNGVVYLLGRLDTTMEDPAKREERRRVSADRIVALAATIEKDVRRVRDVRDVVFKLDNVIKRGGRWRAIEGTVKDRRVFANTPVVLRSSQIRLPGDRREAEDEAEGEVRE